MREDFAAELRAHGMDLIFLLAPTSTEQRMQKWRVASGYVYYVSLKGVTGSGRWTPSAAVEAMLPASASTSTSPVGVGFGIRDAATAKTTAKVADAGG